MHISEGVLSAPVLGAGAALAAAGTAVGLKKMDYEHLPRVALISAVFFVASLIHLPLGPTSMHLVLSGLTGLILGWASFPAILVALALQALLFQFGGLLVLGVNTVTMALPAVVCYLLFSRFIRIGSRGLAAVAAFLAGAGAIFLSALLTAASLYLSGDDFITSAQAVVVAHLPIMAVEGLITAAAVSFLHRVRPAMLRPNGAGGGEL